MTIYIVVLLISLILGVIIPNKTKKGQFRYIVTIFFIMTTISSLRKYTIGIDLSNQYYSLFTRARLLPWSEIGNTAYDIGYIVFNKLIGLFTADPQWLIGIHSIIVIGISGWFIFRNSEDVVLSTFMFISSNTWFMYMNVLRQGLAVSLILIATEIWKNRSWKRKRYLLVGLFYLIAISIHSSAAIVIVFPLFRMIKFRQKEVITSLIGICISYTLYNQVFSIISSLLGFRRDYASFYEGSIAGRSVINFISLYGILIYILFFMLAYYTIIYRKRDSNEVTYIKGKKTNSPNEIDSSFLMYILLCLLASRVMALQSNIIGRMAYYFIPFSWILVPRAVNAFPGASNRKIIRATIYIIMSIAFVWIGYRSAAVLYGTVPYSFFWN